MAIICKKNNYYNKDKVDIGKRLNDIRCHYVNVKLSQKQFCDLIGIKQHNFSRYERGLIDVPIYVLVKLYTIGYNLNWIITRKGNKTIGG